MITVLNENNNYLNIDTIEDRPDLASVKLPLLNFLDPTRAFQTIYHFVHFSHDKYGNYGINISSSLCGDIKIDRIAVRFSVFL